MENHSEYSPIEILLAKVRCVLHIGSEKQQAFLKRCIDAAYNFATNKMVKSS